MKKIFSLLCAAGLSACGGEVSSSDPRLWESLSAVEQAGVHGYEINVPIGEQAYLPSEWFWEMTDVGPFVHRQDQARTGTMDWGGGSVLYNVRSPSRPPMMRVLIEKGIGYQVVGHVTGIFNHIQPGLVRGTSTLEIEQDSQPVPTSYQDLELVLQVQDGSTWTELTKRTLYTGWSFYPGEIETTVQPGTPVRMEIRALRSPSFEKMVYLTKMRLFGAQCYPDFASPGSCL